MRWTVCVEGGLPTPNSGVVRVDNQIYIIAGFNKTMECQKCWIFVFNMETLRWKNVCYVDTDNSAPEFLFEHTTVAYRKKIYVYGGVRYTNARNIVHCFDTDTLEWSTPEVGGNPPSGRFAHSACVVKDRMYVLFGNKRASEFLDDMYYLNLDTMVWKQVNHKGQIPSTRNFASCLADGDLIYIFGGRRNVATSSDSDYDAYNPYLSCSRYIHCFDTITETWINLMPSGKWPEPRRSQAMWLHSDFIYIFGGYNDDTKIHYGDMYRYSLKGNSWEQVTPSGNGPTRGRRHGTVISDNKVYLMGGLCSDKPPYFSEKIFILDYSPRLFTLSLCSVIQNRLQVEMKNLPERIRVEIEILTVKNQAKLLFEKEMGQHHG